MLTGCPSAKREFGNVETGELVDDRCRKVGCPFCCLVLVDQYAKAIMRAAPARLVTFTLVGHDWPTARTNLNRAAGKIRAKGYDWEYAYTVEPNRENGLHAHAWVHGSQVPDHVLNAICADVGIGKPDIVRADYDGPQFYGLKRAQEDATRADHLRLNGGRLLHCSRKFFRDRHGNPCSMTVAIGRRSSAPSPWVRLKRDRGVLL